MRIVLTDKTITFLRAYGEYATSDYIDIYIDDQVQVISTRNGLEDKITGTLEMITGNQIYIRTSLDLIPIMTDTIYFINKLDSFFYKE